MSAYIFISLTRLLRSVGEVEEDDNEDEGVSENSIRGEECYVFLAAAQ